jgi:hypothetical protein
MDLGATLAQTYNMKALEEFNKTIDVAAMRAVPLDTHLIAIPTFLNFCLQVTYIFARRLL